MTLRESKYFFEELFSNGWTNTPIQYGGEEFTGKGLPSWINIFYTPEITKRIGYGDSTVTHSSFNVVCWADTDVEALTISDEVIRFMNKTKFPNGMTIDGYEVGAHGWEESNKAFTMLNFNIKVISSCTL
jgi:hypothetical protein